VKRMGEPKNYEEYLKRSAKNQSVTGHGLGNVMVYAPCPFCAAKDFMVYELMTVHEAMQEDRICSECERGAKFLLDKCEHGSLFFEMVQTSGPDQPEWLPFKMRRMNS